MRWNRFTDFRTREQFKHRHKEMKAERLGGSIQEKGCAHQMQSVLDISARSN